jgi:dihydroflavonol-4-reductase
MIAVTGANGLLGSFILRKLADEKIPAIGLHKKNSDYSHLKDLTNVLWRELEILDPLSVEEGIKGATHVIHTAAYISFNPLVQKKIMAVNVEGTKHIVNACLAQNMQQLIHISSVAALGRKKEIPIIDETSRWVESDLNTDYAKSKYLGEVELWRGAEEGLPAAVINPSVILAPSDWEKSSAQLFHYVWKEKKFYTENQVNYVDARDVAEMVWQVYSKKITGERFIANGGTIEIKELFDLMAIRFNKKSPSIKIHPRWVASFARLEELRARLMGRDPLITRQTAKITKENFSYLNTKATSQLGVSFRKLEETLDWCCNYYLQTYTTNK